MQLKPYQHETLAILRRYLAALCDARAAGRPDWDRAAWAATGHDPRAYQPCRDGAGDPVPVVCLTVPTGGGKTLLAAHAIDLFGRLVRRRQTGLVLWIVPSTQIYRQTWAALGNRAHPYRRILDLSSGGRTLLLERHAVFSPADVAEHLAVLLLMLPAANRHDKETLRLFRDQGGFDAFFPPEDHWPAQAALLDRVPNLDTFATPTITGQRLLKTSLGNVLRLLNPLIVLDEGHRAYSPIARQTLLGFNPCAMLELSATPPPSSNRLVTISGRDLHHAGMIKLDINLVVKAGAGWRETLRASYHRRAELERSARRYQQCGGDYIRPICLIQVERTGANQRRPDMVHAEDARAYLIERCGVSPAEIAVKSSERDEIEDLDLLDPGCPIRYIITRQALQEGWDCPFAYVLAVLTNIGAQISLTQLVGRVLRQPYARKTGVRDLDECYVYCFRERTGEALAAVRTGLDREGLADLAAHVTLAEEEEQGAEPALSVAEGSREQRTENREQGAEPALSVAEGNREQRTGSREQRTENRERNAGRPPFARVTLACLVVADERGGWRELRYEADVLSRIDWRGLELPPFAGERSSVSHSHRHEQVPAAPSLADDAGPPAVAPDLVFITRQLLDIVPSPWLAYDLARAAVARLPAPDHGRPAQHTPELAVAQLRRHLGAWRDRQVAAVLGALAAAARLRLLLLRGPVGAGQLSLPGVRAAEQPPPWPGLWPARQAWALDSADTLPALLPLVYLLGEGRPGAGDGHARLAAWVERARPLPWQALAAPPAWAVVGDEVWEQICTM